MDDASFIWFVKYLLICVKSEVSKLKVSEHAAPEFPDNAAVRHIPPILVPVEQVVQANISEQT